MEIVVFYVGGAAAIGSAIAVVVQRNPFLAALSLILHLASLAALYLVLQGDFVAVAQLLVYAGAVMVMFLFVIAYLGDRSEDSPWSGGPSWQIVGAVLAGGALLAEVCVVVGLKAGGLLASTQQVDRSFGSPEAIGKLFLTDHLLAFEITSVVLLVAAVGGVVLGAHARRLESDARP
jgi:NADH-quinone oxidoreductase subunit J